MTEERSAYRQIMKATSIFGGVQFFQIIIGIIRSKFIAVLLGPAGMGISGMLQATLGMISAITNFGLSSSAIKNISAAQAENNEEKIGKVVAIFRRLIWVTGILGALITLISSSLLSQITFGNNDYTFAFALLSITLLINQISAGQSVFLNAMRQIKLMAKSSIIGSLLGLITTIPIFYMYGVDGIVPSLIIVSLSSFFLSWFFASKLPLQKVKVSIKDIWSDGKEMLIMGFMISLSGIITLIVSYLVRVFISNYGNIEDIGLYNAGFAIVNSYVGLIFTAMATDYYPKLSAVANDNIKANETINQQAEIAILILSPIILIFIFFIKWIVIILYSHAFIAVDQMILFAAAGMIFKALSWAIAFLFLARGAGRLFFWNELVANFYMLGFNILGYYWAGLKGLGIAFLTSYVLYAFQTILVSKQFFKFKMSSILKKIVAINILITLMGLISVFSLYAFISNIVGVLLIVLSVSFNLSFLNKMLGLKSRYFGS